MLRPHAKTVPHVAFTFPGQGAYHPAVLRALYTETPHTRPAFAQADAMTQRLLGCTFLPLVTAPDRAAHDAHLQRWPDLDQVGIYLSEVLLAQLLLEAGCRPDLLVGHSFGELAALAIAGVYTLETGLEIVGHRVRALQTYAAEGRMAALSCDADTARALVQSEGVLGVEVSVCNQPRQTVLSGPLGHLEALAPAANARGISLTVLQSRYPFHASYLAAAVAPFETQLRSFPFAAPQIPVLCATAGRRYTPEDDLPALLAAQFVTPLNFQGAVETCYQAGVRYFIECGAGQMVSKLIGYTLKGRAGVAVLPTALPDAPLAPQREAACRRVAQRPAQQAPPDPQRAHLERLIGEMTRLLDQARQLHAQWPEPAAGAAPPADPCPEVPIAIVSMGCVLPGAGDPDAYWRLIAEGQSGIVDLAARDPHAAHDYVAGSAQAIVADKTYTLLNGAVPAVPYAADLVGSAYAPVDYEALTRGQKMLAVALGQSLAGLKSPIADTPPHCILGATADGSDALDDALLAESLHRLAQDLEAPTADKTKFCEQVNAVLGYTPEEGARLAQHTQYAGVAERVLGRTVDTYIVDSACSSSLYAIDLGVKVLRSGMADTVWAGGVFAPGPANNALFAQFRGLTPTGSRPLDTTADGVVFGDGAAVVVLKRLPDALRDGDAVQAVIRGSGLSSDGKSPSINVPRSKGQALALRRAYAQTQISVDTVQYIEAHATATPVGDAVELHTLNAAFEDRNPALPPVAVGSIKALIGHTGWVSGVASVLKVCKMFEAGQIPRQFQCETPNPNVGLQGRFTIPRQTQPWPAPPDGRPRRAGINAFGFGGTNAHLILEAFAEDYHRQLCAGLTPPLAPPDALAVVGVCGLFPEPPDPTQFDPARMRLPDGKRLLPDVTDAMDPSQFLAARAAAHLFKPLPQGWLAAHRAEVGVVLGMSGKSARGIRANERIFLDRLQRLFEADPVPEGIARVYEQVLAAVRAQVEPSGPYTLPGLMPNVAAGRIASLYNLNGPNLVMDQGGRSIFQALTAARQLLVHGNCTMVLAGGLHAAAGYAGTEAEGALLLALTTPETAAQHHLPVRATLSFGTPEATHVGVAPGLRWGGAQGAEVLHHALQQVQAQRQPLSVGFGARGPALRVAPAGVARPETPPASDAYAFVQSTPITSYTPVLVPEPAPDAPLALTTRRLLFLTDQPARWHAFQKSGALEGLTYTVACPADCPIPGAVQIDLASEATLAATLPAPDEAVFDTLVVFKDLTGFAPDTLLTTAPEASRAILDLTFAVCRHVYVRLQAGGMQVAGLCLSACTPAGPDPYTGLLAGFLKALAREVPQTPCRVVHVAEADGLAALKTLALELGQSGSGHEVCHAAGTRYRMKLKPLASPSAPALPLLDAGAVVLATGGGRGVTAVLAEALLQHFGCTVVALGRTDPAGAPAEVLAMDEAAFKAYEGTFYRTALQATPAPHIKALKQTYRRYQAAHELHGVVHRLQALPGTFAYRQVDLNEADALDRVVAEVYARYGRIDLILHGAGIQDSRALPGKTLAAFRSIINTKLQSLGTLYRACRAHGPMPHVHLLTSAFSYLGNDGQPDYGAANETLNRLAAGLHGQDAHWSAMAWLGWAGIGMTRGSEFAALAARRHLRGITKAEGQALFLQHLQHLQHPDAPPVHVLLAEGERAFYQPALVAAVAAPSAPEVQQTDLSVTVDDWPMLRDHLVRGVPTLPGALLVALGAQAARKLRPGLKIKAFERTRFVKFARVYAARSLPLRLTAHVEAVAQDETVVCVQVRTDFYHKSGRLLQADLLLTEIFVRMGPKGAVAPPGTYRLNGLKGLHLPDPYVMPGSPLALGGAFDSMKGLVVGASTRKAQYHLTPPVDPNVPHMDLLPNVILVDAFWRFGTVQPQPNQALAVYVPVACHQMQVFFDYTDFTLADLTQPFTFTGANPREAGDLLHVGPLEAYNAAGALMLRVEGGVCRRYGLVEHAY